MKIRPSLFIALFLAAMQTAIAQTSPHGTLRWSCETCHSTDSWKMRSDASFDHAATGFALEGQHKTVQCASCHKDLKFAGAKSSCTTCHLDVHKSELGANCTRCHAQQSWKINDMIQRHQLTRFPLLGRHATLSCQDCHAGATSRRFVGTPIACIGCHRSDFEKTAKPSHASAGFSKDCVQCHKANAFEWGSNFDHMLTKFPLTGAHVSTSCTMCHKSSTFKGTPLECFTCHQSVYQATVNPNHAAAKFPTACVTCHTTMAWRPSTFSHDNTKFPLTGAHRAVACKDCHTNNQYTGMQTNCIDCHRTDFANTTNPSHQAGGFSQNCTQCHTTTTWKPASFDHNATKFALTGKHSTTTCQSCHTNGNYQLTFTDCYQCHQADFQRPTNPNHITANFSHQCQTCHTTTVWKPASFDHSTTKFALTGKHTTVSCQSCHTNGNYQLTYTNCYQCHQTDFTNTTNPSHQAGGFSQNCTQCHTTTAWKPASFDHSTTKFALTGKHTTVSCQSCHVNSNYQLTYTNCYQCHQTDFTNATNPSHQAGGFSQNCTQCHTTTAWKPASFDHSTTKFALTGKHTTVSCQSCHTNGNYQLTYTNCYQCHQTDFTNTTNPSHQAGGFSQNCTQCHTTTAWKPASFDHNTTKFALTGKHTTTTCQSCHVNSNYQLTYNDCYQCHQTDYQRPTNPNHVVPNFSHQCQICHTTTAWTPSTFDHDTQYFRIYSGEHRGKWSQCSQCHANPSSYADFTCISCHEHSQSNTDGKHRGVNGYVYTPTSCYNCHKRV
ncbi:MAG: hypothetical protein HYR76_01440 [Ignavibacteria bacterium]|nr:hypothetical protein [Ignavibacteria bacterium]